MANKNLLWITRRFWWFGPGSQGSWQVLVICLLLLGYALPARAQNLVTGQVLNAITKAAVPGVTVTVLKGAQELGKASSNPEGFFQVAIELPRSNQPQSLTLEVIHPDFSRASRTFQLVSGKPMEQSLILLLPANLTPCKIPRSHCVVVGHFLAPSTEQYTELSGRVATALTFDLNTKLQAMHVNSALQPVFFACEEAKIRAVDYGKYLAEALGADAFIFGTVKAAPPGYEVSICVCDSYGLFDKPEYFKNQHVELDDPFAAQLQPQAHVAILTAIAAGYVREKKFVEGFQVTEVARQLLGDLPPKIQELRSQCQNQLPQRGLLPGGHP